MPRGNHVSSSSPESSHGWGALRGLLRGEVRNAGSVNQSMVNSNTPMGRPKHFIRELFHELTTEGKYVADDVHIINSILDDEFRSGGLINDRDYLVSPRMPIMYLVAKKSALTI